ncbi:hypothetical protein DBR32_06745 [Taibaiella sp. KBW10]|uniref:hypothetical protein n=1 Tax=Taibaiella sp. KBW10 TaxID=2153357 RepID=UPI000F59994D|nr:hypothetical protein [Taibaiella sp. KBW10]RQO31645.1 hypothetical protein DBR32_06745 [Taibaiella sp. KBW10]
MKHIRSHIIIYLCCLLWSGMTLLPFHSRAQITSTTVLVMPSPVIDSVGYHCYGGLPIQVYVSNQISPCVYSIQSTIPAIAPIPDNSTGTFYNVIGITDAVFRVHNGACYTDKAVHFDCNGEPLPVRLTDFSARLYQDHEALISWAVQEQSDILRYEVEESADGRVFKYLSTTAAGTGTSQHYEYIDEQLYQGYNFYRLKIIGTDGSVQYSAVRFVIYNRGNEMVWYPNPTSRYLYLEFYNEAGASSLDIKVYNSIAGSQWIDRSYKLQSGLNKLAIDVGLLADGAYHMIYGFKDSKHRGGTIKFQKVTQ